MDAFGIGKRKGKDKSHGKGRAEKGTDGAATRSDLAKNNQLRGGSIKGKWLSNLPGYCGYCGRWGHRQKYFKTGPKEMARGRPLAGAAPAASAAAVHVIVVDRGPSTCLSHSVGRCLDDDRQVYHVRRRFQTHLR